MRDNLRYNVLALSYWRFLPVATGWPAGQARLSVVAPPLEKEWPAVAKALALESSITESV